MLQLIYMSTAADGPAEPYLRALCEQAQRNNGRDEITGLLLGEGKTFLQVLEGPKEVVEDTFLRIIVDERHHGLLLLSRRRRTVREFGEWSMALCDRLEERRGLIERVRLLLNNVPLHLQQAFDGAFPPGAYRSGPAAPTRTGAAPPP